MKKLFALCVSMFLLIPGTNAAPVHTYTDTITISDSITLTKVKEFHSGHNISYSYIKADLTDENTSLKLLTPRAGIDKLDTVGNLAATDSNTVAALNADFFSTAGSGKALAIGIEVKDGQLLQSPINPGTMATVSYDGASVAMSYLDFHIMAVAPNGQYKEVRHLNKHTAYYGDILMYTKEFNGGYSPAPGGEVAEVVVSDGKIVEFRRNMPPVAIPEDGCVLVVSEGMNMFLGNNFMVGDPIRFDYYITPSLENAVDAFGAGGLLVSEGTALSQFSHEISGYNPRSAIGIDRTGTTLYLVAVDGRQEGSRGMTMKELANLMASLGCYTAANLDGGGSTNMVASTLWNKNMHTVNNPTENRSVINAIGVTHNAASSAPAGIVIEAESDTVYAGNSINLTAAPHDENLRPVDAAVTWSVSDGFINGGVFTSDNPGIITVEAKCGDITASKQIYVWDKVNGIETEAYVSLSKGESKTLGIRVFDADGNTAYIANVSGFNITSSDSSVVSVNSNTLTAHKSGRAVITIEKDGAVSFTSVTVGQKAQKFTDSFEVLSGEFTSYPSYVRGNVSLSNQRARSGKSSGLIDFDFTEDNEDTKAVYYTFDSKTVIADSCDEITLYAYSEDDYNHNLKAQLYDAEGNAMWLTFAEGFEGGRWHQLTAQIPADAARPVKLDKIYAVYVEGDVKDAGSVHIDDLSFETAAKMQYLPIKSNIYTGLPYASSGVLRIGALSDDTATLFREIVNSEMTSFVKSAASHVLLGSGEPYGITEDSNAVYIRLNNSKGSIRGSDSSQWDKIAATVNSTAKNNIFVIAENGVAGSNAFENDVFEDYFNSVGKNKNVYVISKGIRNTYLKDGNINYFTVANNQIEETSAEHMQSYECLEFSFDNGTAFKWTKIYGEKD